ncbi:MAG: DNA repair helicase XPB [Actinomycetota bacterium]
MADPLNPLIVQSDLTVLLEVATPRASEARAALARFAELEKSPEHIHTYRITSLSLWNAASAGMSPGDVAATITGLAKYPVPGLVLSEIHDQMGRYGRLRIVRDFDTGALALTSHEPALLEEVVRDRRVAELVGERLDGNRFALRLGDRGAVKQALIHLGWPASDEAGYAEGDGLEVELTCTLRGYQADAVAAWWADGTALGGSGVLVLPCGAGKTVVGISALSHVRAHSLIIVTSISAARQWIAELRDKTDIDPDLIGEYSGECKEIRPITVATYQILTWAGTGSVDESDLFRRHPHLGLFDQHQWGLVVYDEVHLLPAPVFRATARIQAIRRLGLTATLIREDGRQADVFSLIGPKRFDAPWRELETQGWIAPATCTEVRVGMTPEDRMAYAVAGPAERYRIAATAPEKLVVADRLCRRHPNDQILVIGQYLDQLREAARLLDAPIITGQTAQRTRDERFDAFRRGDLHILVVSKVANFAIDLPEASVAVQLSGTFGSRQEEAQRLGRLLRPKADGRPAHFYTLVTGETVDQRFAANRQRFLTEQGYGYSIVDADEL